MMETIDRPPRTVMEVFKILPEGTLAEVIDDRLYMSPQRSAVHQRVLLLVASSLILYVEASELGEVIISPFDVYLDELSNVVQPDIVYVSKENASITQDHIHGVPDLLVEILLPENKKYDQHRRRICTNVLA